MQPQTQLYTTIESKANALALSMEARIALRKAGLSKLSYLLDKVYASGEGQELTIAQMAEVTGIQRDTIEKTLKKPEITLPAETREEQEHLRGLIRQNDCIFSLIKQYTVKTSDKVSHRPAKVYHLPASGEIDTALDITYPTFMIVNLDTYLLYKADISQFLTVKQPGMHSRAELAEAAGISTSTVSRHEKIAKTTVIKHTDEMPLATWGTDNLPEDYFEYANDAKKFPFRGAWLEFKGHKSSFAKTGYQKLRLLGGTEKTIVVKWFIKSDHFAREGLTIEEPEARTAEKWNHLSDAVSRGYLTMENFMQAFPKSFASKPVNLNWRDSLLEEAQHANGISESTVW